DGNGNMGALWGGGRGGEVFTGNGTLSGQDATIDTTASPHVFNLGTTTITCDGADSNGNAAATKVFHVVVASDTTPPVLTTPGMVTVPADSPTGASSVTFSVTANDNLD